MKGKIPQQASHEEGTQETQQMLYIGEAGLFIHRGYDQGRTKRKGIGQMKVITNARVNCQDKTGKE